MATKKAVALEKEPEAQDMNEEIENDAERRVKIRLFKDDYRYKDALFVGINGKTWLIQRGVDVEVPAYVADFIDQLNSEEQSIMQRVEMEEREYINNTKSLG